MAEPQRRPLTGPSDAELERALRDLGARLAYPPTPDLAAAVRARLASEPPPRRPPIARPWPVSPRWAVAAAAAILLILAAALTLSPDVRTAVADRLGLRGVQIRFLEQAPTVAPSPVGRGLGLGRRVTLAEAEQASPFPVAVPTAAGWDAPDEVYLSGSGQETVVWFVYRARPDLPASPPTGVGALLAQFRGEVDRPLMMKGLGLTGDDATPALDVVAVGRSPGFWITGDAHYFLYTDPSGQVRQDAFRLAGNALLWERGDLTFRLESTLGKEDALAVAASIPGE